MSEKTPYQSIILMGQAGCGKGTQAQLLSDALGYEIFSTGDKSREYAAMEGPLGDHIAQIHTTGWIPEWLASYVMTKALLEDFADKGLVFESVARKPEEAKKLHEIHTAVKRPYKVVYLECDEEVVRERMLARGRAGYDTPDKIAKRLQAFKDETMESIEFFASQGALITVDSNKSAEETFTDILNHIKE